jgi:hypothetical protein
MNNAVREQVRVRATSPIDLKAITPEQAIYAVLDRALLWAELENSWRPYIKATLWLGLPGCLLSLGLWSAIDVPWIVVLAPIGVSALLLAGMWLRHLHALAQEGIEARIVANMSRAVQPPTVKVPQ